jgi:hypothetical protein
VIGGQKLGISRQTCERAKCPVAGLAAIAWPGVYSTATQRPRSVRGNVTYFGPAFTWHAGDRQTPPLKSGTALATDSSPSRKRVRKAKTTGNQLRFHLAGAFAGLRVLGLALCACSRALWSKRTLQLFTYEPDTDNAGNFIVVGNIGIDGIDRHGWSA